MCIEDSTSTSEISRINHDADLSILYFEDVVCKTTVMLPLKTAYSISQ